MNELTFADLRDKGASSGVVNFATGRMCVLVVVALTQAVVEAILVAVAAPGLKDGETSCVGVPLQFIF